MSSIDQIKRAIKLYAEDKIVKLEEGLWQVMSSDKEKDEAYTTTIDSCTCPAKDFGNPDCVHRLGVWIAEKPDRIKKLLEENGLELRETAEGKLQVWKKK